MKSNPFVTFYHKPTQWLEAIQLGSGTLLRLSRQTKTIHSALATLNQLSPDDYLEFMIAYYETGYKRFGESWGYVDLLTMLQAATTVLKPQQYLEIGVRRGRSLAIVANAMPTCDLYGFDLWIENYAGMTNPGPDFVRAELKRLKYTGQLTLISGDSKETVPQFLNDQADLYFDLITVDGDHSEVGAKTDLENVIDRLKVGGVLLLDDIGHPQHRYLETLWDKLITENDDFDSMKYTELGYGIAFAIRRRQ